MSSSRRSRPLREVVEDTSALVRAYEDRARRKEAKRGRALEREMFHQERHGPIDHAALGAAMATMAFPNTATDRRWVPIGPTVNRRGQAMSRPRTSGRIRDLAVSPDGTRAYALSAKGGVWYSSDSGLTWAPVGGWADRSVNALGNGNMFSGGCLLVDFSLDLAVFDVVMVGTGEGTPWLTNTNSSGQGGIGVLVGLGPSTSGVAADPWEPDTGASVLSGHGIYRMARHPAAHAFSTSVADRDRVVAATSHGLYIGTRKALPEQAEAAPTGPGKPPTPHLPVRDGFEWVACACDPTAVITDVLWITRGAGTRIIYTMDTGGVFYSDNDGLTSNPEPTTTVAGVNGRMSLAQVPATNRVYVLAEVSPGAGANLTAPTVWRIPDATAASPTAVVVGTPPVRMFGDPTKTTQCDYDQAIAVEAIGPNDRIYLGGSTIYPRDDSEGSWAASLWCFETPNAANGPLAPVAGVSRRRDPPAGDGGDIDGLIGNNVHADVHVIRLAGPAAPGRHVWVGCDGGVYTSQLSGRVNTFASRNVGLATLEPIFLANHPTSSHHMLIGLQDNGSQVRVGDTVWESTFLGDGGGSLIHPVHSHITVSQYTKGVWNGLPADAYRDPLSRQPGDASSSGREVGVGAWASGIAAIADTATTARVALGTNRVWISDHLGENSGPRWRTLPYPSGVERDTRPNGTDPAALQTWGVPTNLSNPAFGTGASSRAEQVLDVVWQDPLNLLVLYRGGVVRYTNTDRGAGRWQTTVWALTDPQVRIPTNARMTCLATVPSSLDFYVGTLGSTSPTEEVLWHFANGTNTWTATGCRSHLDHAGPPVVIGPLDPVFSVVVDPAAANDVYVGTATGVWKATKTGATTWSKFEAFANGLPQATVQDLRVWRDPANPAGLRLLRAGVQSRGVWEVDLGQAHVRRTYVRVHDRDDRRILPSPLKNPRRRANAPDVPVFASPDIGVRPQWPRATPPAFHTPISSGNVKTYDLWTFQTAFRWLYPSCLADGQWSDAMRDLVRLHRAAQTPTPLSPAAVIDRELWNRVVGGVRLKVDPADSTKATVSNDPADPLAVYRPPWQALNSFELPATEIDLMETVLPSRVDGDEWVVFREQSTVDVLLHHRDSRATAPASAFAILLWREAATQAALLATPTTDLVTYLAGAMAAGINSPPAAPGGWQVATNAAGAAMRVLTSPLDARLPRAVSLDVDLSAVPVGHRVMFLALVGSLDDDAVTAPVGTINSLTDLVRGWPHAAMRIVKVRDRA